MGEYRRGRRTQIDSRVARDLCVEYGGRWYLESVGYCDCGDEECLGDTLYCENRVFADESAIDRALGRVIWPS